MKNKNVLILGAGYTGLAAAVELSKQTVPVTLIEKSGRIGGLSKTITLNDIKFELGPHIYFDKDKDVTAFWKSFVGSNLKTHYRSNRIFFNGKYIKSPLSVWDTLVKLGPLEVTKILLSFAQSKLAPKKINNAEDWVVANFGTKLYELFFKVYNEKIWGLKASEISPNWAGQRIKSSLFTMIVKSVKKDKNFIIKTFDFPAGGSETIYNAQLDKIKSHGSTTLKMNCYAQKIKVVDDGFLVTLSTGEQDLHFTDIISSIHLSDLIGVLEFDTIDKKALTKESGNLIYRNLILVSLVFQKKDVLNFNEHWIDVHDKDVKALRVTNFGNYSVNDANNKNTGLGIEYNCFAEDELWKAKDEEIIKIALADLAKMGVVNKAPIAFQIDRLSKAYPVYFEGFENTTGYIFNELNKIPGLQLAGRNAMYKWNNMHHSVKTGMLAAKNILGEHNDLTMVKGMVSIGKDSD